MQITKEIYSSYEKPIYSEKKRHKYKIKEGEKTPVVLN